MPEPPRDEYPGGLPAWLQDSAQQAPGGPGPEAPELGRSEPDPRRREPDPPQRSSRAAIWMALAAALLVGAIAGAALTLVGGGDDDGGSASSSGESDGGSEVVNLEQRLKQAERREEEAREDLEETKEELEETREQLEDAEAQAQGGGSGGQGGGSGGSGSRVQRISGNGPRDLGTLDIPADSLLRWTNRGGGLFAFTTGTGPKTTILSSNQGTGSTELPAGTYSGARVLQAGAWTIDIRPR